MVIYWTCISLFVTFIASISCLLQFSEYLFHVKIIMILPVHDLKRDYDLSLIVIAYSGIWINLSVQAFDRI